MPLSAPAVAGPVSEAPDLSSAVGRALTTICRTDGWDYGEAWISGEDGMTCSPAFYLASPRLLPFRHVTMRLVGSAVALPRRVARTGADEWIDDVQDVDDEIFCRREAAAAVGLCTAAAVPIVWRSEVVAVVVVFRRAPSSTPAIHRERLAGLATALANSVGRKRAEEALRASEERFQLAAQATNDVIWDWDRDAGEVVFTDNFERVFGYAERRVDAGWWMSRVHPEDLGRLCAAITPALDGTAQQWSIEYRLRAAAGDYRDCRVKAFIVRDLGGRAVRMVGSLADMTADKERERELAEMVRKLEAANRDLDSFAYVVSHDLKAPLRGISSLATWLVADQKDRLDDDGRDQLGLLVRRVRRMNELIDGVLHYSRIGRINESASVVDTGALVRDVIDGLSPPAHVTIRVDGAFPRVSYPRTVLSQIFQNLISNALKHNDRPRPEVIVSCRDDGERWIFAVSDNGRGIEERHFGRIFELFQTVAPHDRNDSSGIGLALVKKMVNENGGEVTVTSTVGSGSTFSFSVVRS